MGRWAAAARSSSAVTVHQISWPLKAHVDDAVDRRPARVVGGAVGGLARVDDVLEPGGDRVEERVRDVGPGQLGADLDRAVLGPVGAQHREQPEVRAGQRLHEQGPHVCLGVVAGHSLELVAGRGFAARVRPARDDKVVAAWNGLAITGLCEVGVRLDRPDLVAANLLQNPAARAAMPVS